MKYGSQNVELFLVDGYNLAPSLMETITRAQESISQQTNPFGAVSEQHTPVGIEKFTLVVGNGFYDPTTDPIHDALTNNHGISRIICVGDQGNVIGKAFRGYAGVLDTKFEVLDQNGNLTRANVTYLVSGTSEQGIIVQHLLQKTADWDTKTGGANATDAPVDYTLDPVQRVINITSNSQANPTVVTTSKAHGLATNDIILISGVITSSPTINGQRTVTVISPTTFSVPIDTSAGAAGTGGSFVRSNTQGGGVGYQHVTDYTGFTKFVGQIMHSPDDSTYASLIAFTDLASVHNPAVERKSVAGDVDRYLSFNGDITGSGTVTVFCGFARG